MTPVRSDKRSKMYLPALDGSHEVVYRQPEKIVPDVVRPTGPECWYDSRITTQTGQGGVLK